MAGTRYLFVTIAFAASLMAAHADPMAYMGTDTKEFGIIDLTTGAFTSLGTTGSQILAGMAVADGDLFGTAYHTASGALYSINPTTGALTSIGNSSVDIDDFGSTTSGLYAIGVDGDLYSLNSSTGAATDWVDRDRIWLMARPVDKL